MKLSELINELVDVLREGDMPVVLGDADATRPQIEWRGSVGNQKPVLNLKPE